MKTQTMKTLVASITIAVAAAALAGPRSIKEIMKTPVNDLTPEERVIRTEHMKETKLRIFGEDVVKPGSQKGKIVFVNAQGRLPESEIESAAAMIRKCAKFNLAVQTGGGEKSALDRAAGACAEYGANVALVVVSDATTPAMLVAPEDRWAVVNVQRLAEGIPPGALNDRMFAARCRKEIVRAFSLLCGGGASQFAGNMMGTATIADLDTVQEFIPIDMERRWSDYLADIGVKPAYQRTYKQACKEGWAPPPTNDIQRAIWDKVHQIPDKPIKIEFDPKKDK